LTSSIAVEELIKLLKAEIILDDGWIMDDISFVNASDLMSDILSFSKPKSILLTGLTNPQTVRTAEMVDIAVICFIHGKQPHNETVELAKKNQLPLLSTQYSMFDACGLLYNAGLADCIE
jgi:predicted transcriptional regulator